MAESMYGNDNSFTQTTTGTQVGQVSNQQQSNYNVGASYQGLTKPGQDILDLLISNLSGQGPIPGTKALLVQKEKFNPRGLPTKVWTDPETGQEYTDLEAIRINKERQILNTQVAAGSTAYDPVTDIRKMSQERQAEIGRTRGIQETFSQQRASEVAKNLSEYFSRHLGEGAIQSITRGAEAAGTSASSARTLLGQEAVQRESEVAAKTGAELSTQYGQIQANLAGVLENLTKVDPNNPIALLINALQAGRISSQANVGGGSGFHTSAPVQMPSTETTARNYLQPGAGGSIVENAYNYNVSGNRTPAAFYNATGDYSSYDLAPGSGYITVGGEDYEF